MVCSQVNSHPNNHLITRVNLLFSFNSACHLHIATAMRSLASELNSTAIVSLTKVQAAIADRALNYSAGLQSYFDYREWAI